MGLCGPADLPNGPTRRPASTSAFIYLLTTAVFSAADGWFRADDLNVSLLRSKPMQRGPGRCMSQILSPDVPAYNPPSQPRTLARGKWATQSDPICGIPKMRMALAAVHCKKRGVSEQPRGAIFYCFHGNPYCYHGNSKILLPWGVQLHRVFYSDMHANSRVRASTVMSEVESSLQDHEAILVENQYRQKSTYPL